MKLAIAILAILLLNTQSAIKATLTIANYTPLTFNLTFTQPLPLPVFQLLVAGTTLPYRILTPSPSTSYTIQVTQNYQTYDPDNTQAFSLVFNYPLDISSNNNNQQQQQLYINNYILSPAKSDLFIAMSTWPVYLIYTLLVVGALFGVVGLCVIDFVQIYVLTAMKFYNKTSVLEAYSGLFLFDQQQQGDARAYIFALIRPTIILVGVFAFGLVVRFSARYIRNQFLANRIIKFISYNTFLAIWTISLPSIIYKALQFITNHNTPSLTPTQHNYAIIFTYINFINFITYFYLLYFVLNPKVNEEKEEFRKYMLSAEFELYNKFHRGLHLREWVKRNTFMLLAVRKLIVVVLFFISSNILPYVLALQLITSFFIFTVRPYKGWFYTNTMIILNLLWFFSYIVVLEGFLYFNISNTLQTRNSLTKYLVTRAIIFHIVCFLGVIGAGVEGVRLFKNLRYEFKEEVEPRERLNYEIVVNRGRLITQTADDKLLSHQIMKQSLLLDSSPRQSISKPRKRQSQTNPNHKLKTNLFQIELTQLSPRRTDRKLSTRIKKKWKDSSLLEQLATN